MVVGHSGLLGAAVLELVVWVHAPEQGPAQTPVHREVGQTVWVSAMAQRAASHLHVQVGQELKYNMIIFN